MYDCLVVVGVRRARAAVQTYDAASISRVLETMADTRPMRCRDHAYEFTRLEVTDVQVTIATHLGGGGDNDLAAAKLTLTSIVLHTPYDLYDEIIVIDDGTDSVDAQQALATFLQDSRFNKVTDCSAVSWNSMGPTPTPTRESSSGSRRVRRARKSAR